MMETMRSRILRFDMLTIQTPDEYMKVSCHLSISRSVTFDTDSVSVAALAARRAAEPENSHTIALDADSVSAARVALVTIAAPATTPHLRQSPFLKLS